MEQKERENRAQELIEAISARINNELDISYLPPSCPTCYFPLSGYMASTKLICLKCGSVFEPKFLMVEKVR